MRFSSNVSAANKLFAVFGISSLSTVKAKGIGNFYLLQATRKLVLDTIRPAASSKVGSNDSGSFVATTSSAAISALLGSPCRY